MRARTALIVLVLGAALAGCMTTRPSRFYTLTPASVAGAPAGTAGEARQGGPARHGGEPRQGGAPRARAPRHAALPRPAGDRDPPGRLPGQDGGVRPLG